MLTVKVMSSDGSEKIYSGASVGFNPSQQSISISGLDQNIFLEKDEVAFVMNSDGKTISHFKKCTKFKVKTIINGVTSVFESDRISVADAGSERFNEILALTKKHSNPDFAIWLPAVYADAECNEVLQEEALIVSEREGVLDKNALAILIDDFESPEHAKRKALNGLRYQFVYPGDQVYVMKPNGATIETVK